MGYGCNECYDPCGYGYGGPVGGYGCEKGGSGNGFAIIVVLFILLIIVGACGLGGGHK